MAVASLAKRSSCLDVRRGKNSEGVWSHLFQYQHLGRLEQGDSNHVSIIVCRYAELQSLLVLSNRVMIVESLVVARRLHPTSRVLLSYRSCLQVTHVIQPLPLPSSLLFILRVVAMRLILPLPQSILRI